MRAPLASCFALFLAPILVLGLAACGETGVDPYEADEDVACLFSHSCPAGTYCDLERCVQDCNAERPCEAGLVCTARGRCAESASDPSDPELGVSEGLLSVDEPVRAVRADAEVVTVRLEGEGRVRARLVSNAEWITPSRETFEFEGSTEVRIPVASDRSEAADGRDHTATVRVVSSQGERHLLVRRRPAVSGVFSGALAHTSVAHEGRSYGIDLGEASFSIHVRDDEAGLRARIDPEGSSLWPASSSGPATSFESNATSERVRLRFAQILDETSAAPLFPARSASVFSANEIVRELSLDLRITDEGTLEGDAIETIHGLTSTPVVIEGRALLTLRPGVALAEFSASAPPDFPEGPSRDPGLPESTCPPLEVAGCESSSWSCLADPDEGLLASGFALSNFFAPDSTRAPLFEFLPENTAEGLTPYAVVSEKCASEVPDLRADASGPTSDCVDLERLACARWYSASELEGGLSAQGTMYAARATLELFALLANEAMIEATTHRFSSTATPSEMRSLSLDAHARYDAGLHRFFDPRLFEELRAVPPWDAQLGAMSPEVDGDRFPLRLAAAAIRRSREMAERAFEIDRISTTMSPAETHRRAQASAVLTWLEVALAADLDARWRGDSPTLPTNDVLPEVEELGAMMRAIDRSIVTLDDRIAGLGVSPTYVPLLARTSAADVETNYARLFAIAEDSVARSVAADLEARTSQRRFDSDAGAIGQALADENQAILFELAELCGGDFVVGDVPKREIEECGKSSGTARRALLSVETERLELLRSEQQLAAQHDLYRTRAASYASIREIHADHLAFVDATNEAILDLRSAEAAMNGAAAIVGGIVTGGSSGSPWGAAAGAVAGIGSAVGESMAAARHRLKLLLKAEALRVEYEITAIEQAQDLYEAALQFQQLETQVLVKANEVARAYATLASIRERVTRLSAQHRENVSRLSRVGELEVDPSFRIERNADAADADVAFSRARRDLYYAARALEYETNTALPNLSKAILLAPNASHLEKARACVSDAWNEWRLLVSSTNQYVTEVSLARDVLGIAGPVTDRETGEVLDEGRQFRRFLFDQPYSLEAGRVWPALRFGTTLNRSNGLFSTLVCNDRIRTVEVKLVGEALEGERGEVQILVDGSSKLRSCAASAGEEELMSWNLRPEGALAPATVSAGINQYDPLAAPNQSLFYYAVAQDTWIVAIPDGASAPANQGLDPRQIDDIILRITHEGVAASSATASFSPACNL